MPYAPHIQALIDDANTAKAKGDLTSAIASCEKLVEADPANAAFLCNLGFLYSMDGRAERALKVYGDAYAAAPESQPVRESYLNALGTCAQDLSRQGRYEEALGWIRRALALEPNHLGLRIELANALELTGQRAVLSDFLPDAKAEELGTHILIACMPKSGSTFLKAALCELTGWPEANLAYAYLQNEPELYLPNLLQVAAWNTVTQQHCRATGPNVQIMQAFNMRPIVLVRNLPDAVVSLYDFFEQGAVKNTFYGEIWPGLGERDKYDLIIDHLMPWYVQFYASWERVQRQGRLPCLFVLYREMVADKPGTLARIADFLGLRRTRRQCTEAARIVDGDAYRSRFNKGQVGRGYKILSADQKGRLLRLMRICGLINEDRIWLTQ
jgi:hypothetical protein